MKLNSTLFELLKHRFGDVRLSNEGESLNGNYKYDPRIDRTVLDIDSWGETYGVSCPYCNESRQRLCFNHRYGTYDEITRSSNNHMVRCFNEECLKKDPTLYKDLFDKVFGLMNSNERRSISYLRGRPAVTSPTKLTEAPPPGSVELFCDLSPNHPAIKYLEGRGYNVIELMERWNLMYCYSAAPKYSLAQNRIIIPVTQNNMCVGWQARYIGDIDWKAQGIPKFYNLASMPKRMILYNHDISFKQDMVIITEGPTSCWTVWPYGVAILGKQATIQQQRMIIKQAMNKPIVILLDGDAKAEADKLYNNLKTRLSSVVKIELPYERDPGSYLNDETELWDLIIEQSKQQDVDIEGIIKNESRSDRNKIRDDGSSKECIQISN